MLADVCKNLSLGIVIFTVLLIVGCKSTPKTESAATAQPIVLAEKAFPKFINAEALYTYLRYPLPASPLISAHRGGPEKGYPENCIETFAHTLSQAPASLEMDVAATADSVLVLLHDDKLERTTTGTGLIGAHKWADVQQLFLEDNQGNKTPYRIPRLDSALAWGGSRTLLFVDVKRTTPRQLLIKTLKQYEAHTFCVLITYNIEQARYYQQHYPEMTLSLNVGSVETLAEYDKRGVKFERVVCFVGTREPEPALYETLHKRGILTNLGTLGNLDRQAKARGTALYKQWVKSGADILATDEPLLVAKEFGMQKK